MAAATQGGRTCLLYRVRAGCFSSTLALLFLSGTPLRAQIPAETVGRIEGDDIAVKGQVSLLRESNRTTTVLASGSEVTVRSGSARILLTEGSEIGICGPAHFSLVKSGGAIILALNSGRIHARLGNAGPLTVYTPLIVATPLAIGDAPREAGIGLEATGAMCVLAARGAVRLEHQFTGMTLVVPERGEVELPGGQLESLRDAAGSCRCEALLARAEPASTAPPPQVSEAAPASPPEQNKEAGKREEAKPPAPELPTWKVVMPPLTFDAASLAPPPEPSPETILLVREVRVQPTLVFSGRVEPRSSLTSPLVSAGVSGISPQPSAAPKSKRGVGTKIKNFFRRLFGGKPKS